MIFLFDFIDESLLSHLMKKRLETPALAENECERSSMLSVRFVGIERERLLNRWDKRLICKHRKNHEIEISAYLCGKCCRYNSNSYGIRMQY